MFRKVMILSFMLFARALLAQEEMPVIIDPPRVSMTAFTNWQEIQLIYTVRWLDGYRPLFDLAKPENMSFSPFELDPAKGYNLELRNQRKYKKENYVDLIYYLRHIGEKKGEMIIPEQTFFYVKEEAGKTLENLETKEFKTPGVKLRYDSVLIKDANDIMDQIDFGSFKRQENIFKGLMGGLAFMFSTVLFLLFRKPIVYAARKTGISKTAHLGVEIAAHEERLVPKEALKQFCNILDRLLVYVKTDSSSDKTEEAIGHLYNELRRLLLSSIPDLSEADTTKEVIAKIFKMEPSSRVNELLRLLSLNLQIYDDMLFTHKKTNVKFLEQEIKLLKYGANELRPVRIFRYKLHERKRELAEWLTKLFRRGK
ncbi:MAG: hypothetical protein HYT61_02425 [Candidatus Yanofskybacteria bacterium]|nr:hypothetical protein [Candidatus Yanofskybacteria bacterium]